MIRFATYPGFQQTMSYTLNAQRAVYDLQAQVSSGLVSTDYAGVGGNAYRLVTLETQTTRTNQYVAGNKLVDHRLQAMETSVASIYDTATKFRTLLVNALNANNAGEMAIADEAANFKDEITKLLNVSEDGRYLFAGSRTTTAPVDQAGWTPPAWPLTPPLTQYTAEYYKGDQTLLTAEVDVDHSIGYGITAAEDAFEYVLRAMHYVEISGNAVDRATLETSLALVNAALGTSNGDATLGVAAPTRDIADIRTAIGTSRRAIELANKRHEEVLLYTEQNIGDIENVDPAAALTRLSAAETQLQASYMTVSRLSQLSLLNYLS
ncbi:MAG: flagellar hook-filament junction protein FlgL [Alphaproteobacteria bacterium]|nr:MAG: flagellar hook-filament junction protein FlgL [Alphaproteobacteria bacterium]